MHCFHEYSSVYTEKPALSFSYFSFKFNVLISLTLHTNNNTFKVKKHKVRFVIEIGKSFVTETNKVNKFFLDLATQAKSLLPTWLGKDRERAKKSSQKNFFPRGT